MKAFLNVCCALGFSCLLLLAARNLQATAIPEASSNSAGSVARSSAPAVFHSYARTKIVQYFDTYRTDPMGLPPGWAIGIQVNEIPAAWGNSRIAPGFVVRENERTYLMAAPSELIRVLPSQPQDLRYYVAGSNLVAVDHNYKIVDSIQIPTIRLPDADDRADHAQPLQLVRNTGARYR